MIWQIYWYGVLAIIAVGAVVAGFRVVLVRNSGPLEVIFISVIAALLWPACVIVMPLVGLGQVIGYGIVAWRICRENKAREKQDGNEPRW